MLFLLRFLTDKKFFHKKKEAQIKIWGEKKKAKYCKKLKISLISVA